MLSLGLSNLWYEKSDLSSSYFFPNLLNIIKQLVNNWPLQYTEFMQLGFDYYQNIKRFLHI